MDKGQEIRKRMKLYITPSLLKIQYEYPNYLTIDYLNLWIN